MWKLDLSQNIGPRYPDVLQQLYKLCIECMIFRHKYDQFGRRKKNFPEMFLYIDAQTTLELSLYVLEKGLCPTVRPRAYSEA